MMSLIFHRTRVNEALSCLIFHRTRLTLVQCAEEPDAVKYEMMTAMQDFLKMASCIISAQSNEQRIGICGKGKSLPIYTYVLKKKHEPVSDLVAATVYYSYLFIYTD